MALFDRFLDGAIASSTATLFSNPFDLMRTRLQIQGELQREGEYKVLYRNLPQGMWRVARTEGVMALQKGLLAGVLWQFTQNGIRVGLYEGVKRDMELLIYGTGGGSGGKVEAAPAAVAPGQFAQFALAASAAAVCGVTGSVVASPFNLVKTRLQLQSSSKSASVGQQYSYHGIFQALREVYQTGGIPGLWRGCFIAGQREIVLGISQLLTYDVVKRYCYTKWGYSPNDPRVHVVAAVCGAAAIILTTNPLSVVQTRMYNASKIGEKVYSNNLLLATWRIFRVEGVKGLYKGSTAWFFCTAPHAIVTFTVLEFLRDHRRKSELSYYGYAAKGGKEWAAAGAEYTWDVDDAHLIVLP